MSLKYEARFVFWTVRCLNVRYCTHTHIRTDTPGQTHGSVPTGNGFIATLVHLAAVGGADFVDDALFLAAHPFVALVVVGFARVLAGKLIDMIQCAFGSALHNFAAHFQ